MKILYVASKYDYGKPERGYSFEHYNIFDSLYNMGNEIIYFDFMQILKKVGKRQMNSLLLDTARTEKPDLMFVFLLEHEIDPRIISQISRSDHAVTLNWFADDHWRFDNFSRYWAPYFDWVVTTDFDAIGKYHAIGYQNAVLSQWACNHFLYRNLELDPLYDVSFIGQAYGNRRAIVRAIEDSGIQVMTRGHGWKSGKANHEQMIEIFNTSRINLNLANASVHYASHWVKFIDKYALYAYGVKRIWRSLRSLLPTRLAKLQPIVQIKGRNFEIPGSGGFLITDYVRGLEVYYRPDKDIVCYSNLDELIKKIKFYLVHGDLRKEIAFNGWQTTLDRHTYVHRFNQIFQQIGLKADYSLEKRLGRCAEVSVR